MRYCFIINPASGKSETKQGLEEKIKEVFSDAEVFYTEQIGDATRIAEGFCRDGGSEELAVYSCGGDGTLCEVVNGIMRREDRERVHLGVLPVGTGNDFVRNFGTKEEFLDLEGQKNGESVKIDLIKANDFYSVNMINIGFDCQVVVKTARLKKHVPSRLAYICGLVVTLFRKPGVCMRLHDDTSDTQRELLLCTFANGSFCGGGFNSNPHASLCDGRINALFVNNISRTRFVRLVGSYKKGTHLVPDNAEIVSESFSHTYEMSFDAPTEISVDGEIITADRLTLECAANALNVIVPAFSRKSLAKSF